MKKTLKIIQITLLSVILFCQEIFADTLQFSSGTTNLSYDTAWDSFLNTGLLIAIGVVVVSIVITAMKFMSAGSNPQKKDAAKKSLFAEFVALILFGGIKLIISTALSIF